MSEPSQEFAVFMDPAKMKAVFQQALPDCVSGGWMLTDCQIQHPRYKTYLNPKSRDKSFLALAYHLKGINECTHQEDNRIFYAKAYLGTRSYTEYLKASDEASSIHQDAVLHLAKYGMVGWFFPCDPVLLWLPKALEPAHIRRYFSEYLLPQHHSPSCIIKDIALSIVNYRPEIRCTYRYVIKRLSGNTQTIYGKTFADGRGAEIHRRIANLYQCSLGNTDNFVMARPLCYDATLRTIWLEGLHGHAFLDRLTDYNAESFMIRLARHLVDFHNVPLTGLDILSEDEQLTEIQKKAMKLQMTFPCLAKRIETLVTDLYQQKSTLPFIAHRLSHGDFHIQQLLLLDDNRMALFDFDELAMANPLVDVANFCADLYSFNFTKDFTEWLINRLFTAYKIASDADISETHFTWHLRVQLLTRAYRAYIQQKPDHEQLISQFLKAAELGYVTQQAGSSYG